MAITAAEARQKLAGRSIWLWHYMHSDWQWEQSRHWHEERYALAVREALDVMQRDPEFCYFFDTACEFLAAVEQRLGSRLEELKARVREGRVRLLSGQVANCRPTQVGDETYIRNIQLGREYFETHMPPADLSLFHSVDIAIGGVQMPQLLTQAGFKYYRAWRPHGPMNVLGIPQQFVWQGADGSRIVVTRGAYGGSLGDPPLNLDDTRWDDVVAWVYEAFFHDQIMLERSPSGHLWMIQGADDARPLRYWHADRPDPIQRFVAMWREREAIPIRWCTPLEFSQAVAAQASRLPVVEGVLDGADVGYNMANHGANGLWAWRQMNDRRLLQAEWWSAAARSGCFAAPHEELKKLWFEHCTYQAHAQDHGFDDDWLFLVDRARDVKYHAERIEEDALRAIVRAAGGGERTTRYVFNPLPWPVEADVEIYHPCAIAGIESLQVEDPVPFGTVDETGRPLPQQQLREFRHPRFGGSVSDEVRLVRLQLPPMGYRRVEIAEMASDRGAASSGANRGAGASGADRGAGASGADRGAGASGADRRGGASVPAPVGTPAPVDTPDVVETAALRLVYRDHALREVRDLATGRIYSSRKGGAWPGLFYHILDGQDWLFAGPEIRRERFMPESGRWLETGPVRWRHRSAGTLGPYRACLDTMVAGRGRELHVAVRLDGHWETPPATGFATLLAGVEAGGAMTVDTPFAVEPRDPDRDLYYDDVAPGQDIGIAEMFERLRPGVFWGRSWADWSGLGQGLTMISVDGCYYWLKEPGQFGHILLRGVELKPGTWEAFCPVSLTGTGTHTFRYALRFHDGDWRQADPQRRSLELRHAPVVVRADYPCEASLPTVSHSFLSLEGPALPSAYYAAADGIYLRFYEHTGQGGEVKLQLDWQPSSAEVVDLLGEAQETPVSVSGRDVRAVVRPWQIVTLRLRR